MKRCVEMIKQGGYNGRPFYVEKEEIYVFIILLYYENCILSSVILYNMV